MRKPPPPPLPWDGPPNRELRDGVDPRDTLNQPNHMAPWKVATLCLFVVLVLAVALGTVAEKNDQDQAWCRANLRHATTWADTVRIHDLGCPIPEAGR